MIVYQSTKQQFLDDIISNNIENIILENFQKKLGRTTNKNEIASWKNSMMYMNTILTDQEIPMDSGIAIEYQLPQTSKRIDFIVTGKNENNVEHAVLIELKQWSEATLTNMDGVVVTYTGHAEREVSHPSYQVWSYATLLQSFNETVEEDNIELIPCAYLHNYEQENVLTNDFYYKLEQLELKNPKYQTSSYVILSQAKVMDKKRFFENIGIVSLEEFEIIKQKIRALLL